MVNKQLDPENSQFFMETSLNQPRWLPGSMLIYLRVTYLKKSINFRIFFHALFDCRWGLLDAKRAERQARIILHATSQNPHTRSRLDWSDADWDTMRINGISLLGCLKKTNNIETYRTVCHPTKKSYRIWIIFTFSIFCSIFTHRIGWWENFHPPIFDLVGGLEPGFYFSIFFPSYWESSSSQLLLTPWGI